LLISIISASTDLDNNPSHDSNTFVFSESNNASCSTITYQAESFTSNETFHVLNDNAESSKKQVILTMNQKTKKMRIRQIKAMVIQAYMAQIIIRCRVKVVLLVHLNLDLIVIIY